MTLEPEQMDGRRVPGRVGGIAMALAMLAAPFIAMLIRVEAGLFVMALALSAGSLLLREAFDAVPLHFHRWLRLGILLNVALAVMCVGFAAWLIVKR
jgi:hypothetical protein